MRDRRNARVRRELARRFTVLWLAPADSKTISAAATLFIVRSIGMAACLQGRALFDSRWLAAGLRQKPTEPKARCSAWKAAGPFPKWTTAWRRPTSGGGVWRFLNPALTGGLIQCVRSISGSLLSPPFCPVGLHSSADRSTLRRRHRLAPASCRKARRANANCGQSGLNSLDFLIHFGSLGKKLAKCLL